MVKSYRRWPLSLPYKTSVNGLLPKKQLRTCQKNIQHVKITINNKGNKKVLFLKLKPITGSGSSHFSNPNNDSNKRQLVSSVHKSSSLKINTEVMSRNGKTALRSLSGHASGNNDLGKAGTSASFSIVKTRRVATKPSSEGVCLTSIQYEDSSSSDSSEIFSRLGRGSIRALSDYETGDQSGESLCWSNQGSNNPSNSSQQSKDLDFSSENDSVYNVIRSKCKRLHNHLFSTSDSSDSDTPIRQQHLRKRKRIHTSSEDSDEGRLNVTQSYRIDRQNQNDLPRTSRSLEYPNLRSRKARKLRPRSNNQRKYQETESDSSDDEMLKLMRRETNSLEHLSEDSTSGDQLNRTRHSEPNYKRISRSLANRQQVVRYTRQSRSANHELETRKTLALGSESDSSSYDNILPGTIRRRMTSNSSTSFPSDVDSSDTDTSSLFARRRVSGRTVQIEDSDSDSTGEHTLPDTIHDSVTDHSVVPPNPLNSSIFHCENSSGSDAGSEKCPICFSCFGSKEVASPVSCNHTFCTKCIQEWAKCNNTCPIDRKLFNKIMVRRNFNGEVVLEIPVDTPPNETRFWLSDHVFEEELDPTFGMELSSEDEEEVIDICCVCYSSNNSQNFILCDFCNNVYHLSCLTPPLHYVPVYDWFCPPCVELDMIQDRY